MLQSPITSGQTSTNAEFVLSGNTIVRRIVVETPITNAAELMKSMEQGKTSFYPKLLNYGDKQLDFLDCADKYYVAVFGEIPAIPFNCPFACPDLSVPAPVIQPQPAHKSIPTGSLPEKLLWTPEALKKLDKEVQLYFCTVTHREALAQQMQCCYLLIYYKKEFRVLPYPNLFSDAKVCMGDAFERANTRDYTDGRTISLAETWGTAYNHFMASGMNSDLVNNATPEFFSFDLETKQPVVTDQTTEYQDRYITQQTVSNKFTNGFQHT